MALLNMFFFSLTTLERVMEKSLRVGGFGGWEKPKSRAFALYGAATKQGVCEGECVGSQERLLPSNSKPRSQ